MITPADLLTSPDSSYPVIKCRQSSVVLYCNLPTLRLQHCVLVANQRHQHGRWFRRRLQAFFPSPLALPLLDPGQARACGRRTKETLSQPAWSTSSLARVQVSHFSPSRRHNLACAALCDREAARLGPLPYLPAIHDCCCCKKAQHPRDQHQAKVSGAFACRRH
jgi:hypothetical protein